MAYQMGTLISFLPGFLLSGFIYSISSMPRIIQAIALFVPAGTLSIFRKACS